MKPKLEACSWKVGRALRARLTPTDAQQAARGAHGPPQRFCGATENVSDCTVPAKSSWLAWVGLIAALALAPAAHAQRRPYIGYVYPAGGQQTTTVQIKLGGQDLEEITAVEISGTGVTARVVENLRRLNNQEIQLLNEQLKELKKPSTPKDESTPKMIARIEQRTREWVQTPACASISSLLLAEVTIAPDAELGTRELRVVTPRGVSNPLVFQVGQLPEYSRKPMLTATIQILGKEAASLRKRPATEIEDRVALPCTVNGQIASGEVNRYRFTAGKGQRLVISTQARQLIPFIADAVPGWFQPVLALYDAKGKELAYADDYRFKPDPVILFEVPADGEYVFAISDSIYRGREDFVYRITIGDLPFVTSLFPLGGQTGHALRPDVEGWNLEGDADLAPASGDARAGVETLAAHWMGFESNPVPFVQENLPDVFEHEGNNTLATAQPVTLPVVINGRIDRPDDWDVFQFTGKANQSIVAEVEARRLDSPLDSVVKLTDATGRVLAFNDDREDLTAGINTHHADSYLLAKLPADGTYFVHIGDTARKGGKEYGYRLRLSAPQPDFELRVVPSSAGLAVNTTSTVTVYAARKDGFTGPIKLTLNDPPAGFTAPAATIPANQNMIRFTFKAGAAATPEPVSLSIVGTAKTGDQETVRSAVPAEDRMQAFLWRQLVPASDLQVLVFDPRYQPPPKRVARARPPPVVAPSATPPAAATAPANSVAPSTPAAKPKFTKQQIVGRLRQLKLLYEDGLLTDDFYDEKVAECETSVQ